MYCLLQLARPLSCGLAVILIAGCEAPTSDTADAGNSRTVIDAPSDVSPTDHTVCDPFANNPTHPGADQDMGLVGSLQYMPVGSPHYAHVADYVQNGTPVDATIFLNQVFVPTRSFDLGFVTQSGNLIKDAQGDSLYEYFSMRLDAEIRLGATDPVGKYQFALLADDGATLAMDTGGGLQTVVDDDGTHPTQFACATSPVSLDLTSSIPSRILYYQGPRYHIALVALWRPWPENDPSFDPNDPLCGKNGNGYFFNFSTVPSTPTDKWGALLARGWKVLGADNFVLPRAVAKNPCTNPEPVRTFITGATPSSTITNSAALTLSFSSNFASSTFECSLDGATRAACTSPVSYSGLAAGDHSVQVWATDSTGHSDEVGASYGWTIDLTPPLASAIKAVSTRDSITISWTTNEAASSALQWGPTSTMANSVADDGVDVTSHSITLTGLTAGTPYFYKVMGKDQAGNSYQSARFGVLTQP